MVIPLLKGPAMLLNRNLIYTAVTRARKCVTLVGNENTFYEMVQNTSQQKRYSGLKARLRKKQCSEAFFLKNVAEKLRKTLWYGKGKRVRMKRGEI